MDDLNIENIKESIITVLCSGKYNKKDLFDIMKMYEPNLDIETFENVIEQLEKKNVIKVE